MIGNDLVKYIIEYKVHVLHNLMEVLSSNNFLAVTVLFLIRSALASIEANESSASNSASLEFVLVSFSFSVKSFMLSIVLKIKETFMMLN